jgi:dipeptidyl aminopeptidase/acylaminoacyl peptidase
VVRPEVRLRVLQVRAQSRGVDRVSLTDAPAYSTRTVPRSLPRRACTLRGRDCWKAKSFPTMPCRICMLHHSRNRAPDPQGQRHSSPPPRPRPNRHWCPDRFAGGHRPAYLRLAFSTPQSHRSRRWYRSLSNLRGRASIWPDTRRVRTMIQRSMRPTIHVLLPALLVVAWSVLAFAGPLHAQERPVSPDDHYQEVSVGQTAMSPGGDLLAFTVTRVREEDNDRVRSIWMQRLASGQPQGEPFQFTSPAHDSHSPQWSPDGSLLSFQSNRDDSGNSTWFIRVDEPAGEAFRIEGVDASPLWSPDGEWIALVRRPEADGPDDARRVAPDAITSVTHRDRFDGNVITHGNFRQNGMAALLPHPDAVPTPQLWIVPAEGGEARQITDVPFQVMSPAWSQDSQSLIFVGNDAEPAEYDQHRTGGDLYTVSRDGGQVRTLTEEGAATYSDPAVSPDGQTLAFLRRAGQGEPTGLFLVGVDAQFEFQDEPRMLVDGQEPEHPSRSSGSPEWRSDGEALRYDDLIRGDRHLFEVRVDTPGEVRQVTHGEQRLSGFTADADERWLAYVSTAPTRPGEVFVADFHGENQIQISHFNREWLAEVALSQAQVIHWTVADGTEIEGWVLPPVNFDPDQQYPMVMAIHGGPHAAFGNNYSHQFQVMAGQGILRLLPQPPRILRLRPRLHLRHQGGLGSHG